MQFFIAIITFSLGGVDGGEDVIPGPPGGDRHTLVASLLIINTAGGGCCLGGFYFLVNIFIDIFPPITSFGKGGARVKIVLPQERRGSILVIKHSPGLPGTSCHDLMM